MNLASLRRSIPKLPPNLVRRISHLRLPITLAGATIIAIVLTVFSTYLYVHNGVITTDLSRPGYEHIRQEVKPVSNDETTIDTTSPVTPQAIDSFLKTYNQQIQDLNKYSNFTGTALDDATLQLEAGTPTITGQ